MTTPSLSVEAVLALGKLALAFGRIDRATFHEDGIRPETDSDHTIMLGLIALTICPPELDAGLVTRFVLVHDLPEAIAGDTNTAFSTPEIQRAKAVRETEALEQLTAQFGEVAPWLPALILQYEEQVNPEARFVRYLDKAMPKITHILNGCMTIKSMGRTLEEVVQDHSAQLIRLNEQYPEWNNTAASALMMALMHRAEKAYYEERPALGLGSRRFPDQYTDHIKANRERSYRDRQIQGAWTEYGAERAWRNQHDKEPYDAVDYTNGELPAGWVWKDGQDPHSATLPRWVADAVEVFTEDECLLWDPTAPKITDEWLKRFAEPRPSHESALTFYDGGDWIAYLYEHGRIEAGGPDGNQILLVPDPRCKLRHPQGSERGTCECKGPPDCPFGTLDGDRKRGNQ